MNVPAVGLLSSFKCVLSSQLSHEGVIQRQLLWCGKAERDGVGDTPSSVRCLSHGGSSCMRLAAEESEVER